MTKLDTRAARCDLTSRECCKLLCGVLAGVISAGVQVATLRRMFSVVHLITKGEAVGPDGVERFAKLIEGLELNLPEMLAVRYAATILAAAVGAIAEQAAPGAMMTALDWINEHEEVWESAFGTALQKN